MSAFGAYGTFSAIGAHALASVRPHCTHIALTAQFERKLCILAQY